MLIAKVLMKNKNEYVFVIAWNQKLTIILRGKHRLLGEYIVEM